MGIADNRSQVLALKKRRFGPFAAKGDHPGDANLIQSRIFPPRTDCRRKRKGLLQIHPWSE